MSYTDENKVKQLVKQLEEKNFEFSIVEELKKGLGLSIKRDGDEIIISQPQYVDFILDEFKDDLVKTNRKSRTPISKLQKDRTEDEDAFDTTLYRSLLGCLGHLARMTRPDIIQAVFHLAQFAHNPSEKHWKALCGVVDYLSFNKDIGIKFPDRKTFFGKRMNQLRYGENPHQKSCIYLSSLKNEKTNLLKLSGKDLSYNNYNDIFAGLDILFSNLKIPSTVIIKHANPCGVSSNKSAFQSFLKAQASDPISAFGGIVSCNFKIQKKHALELNKLFLEVIIGNKFDSDAIKILKKKKNLRLIDASNFEISNDLKINSINQNILIQTEDKKKFTKNDFKIMSKKKPTKSQFDDLVFAFNVCRYVKSNAIVLANNKTTVGIGSGQPSRLDSCEIAIDKMKKFSLISSNTVAASDAFFPFVDGFEKLVQSGVKAIVQPAGSIRDKEIIKFANETKTILVFSKTRHFRH